FPAVIDPAVVRRGVAYAVERGRTPVGVWLGLDTDPAPLADAGFERGWAPWWMTADLAAVGTPDDDRIAVEEHFGRAWRATAYNGAGRAWSFLDGDLAGVFTMDVWPRFRRQGFGTALLRAVCGAARNAGARAAVLNATPQGKLL